jgi:transposase
MIRPGFLDPEARKDLTELAQDGSAAHRLARRANALVLLDDGMSFTAIAKVLLIDDDTIRTWYALYQDDGIEGLVRARARTIESEEKNRETDKNATNESRKWRDLTAGALILTG